MATKESELIEIINTKYPRARAVPLSEFYDDDTKVGIWFKGSEDYLEDDRLLFDSYHPFNECHPKMEDLLELHDWFYEPYDSGTMMAYPN